MSYCINFMTLARIVKWTLADYRIGAEDEILDCPAR
jgi:hypothetical protein